MDNLILKAKSKYDIQTLLKFNRYNMYSRVQSKIVTILSIFLIVFGVMASSSTMGLRAICVGVGIVWILEMIFLPKVYAKRVYNSSKISSEADVEFEFYSDKFVTRTIKDEKEMSKGELDYKDLYKVVDLKDYIYLYITSNQAFICSKDNIDGDYDKLSDVLKNSLGKKYKIKK